MFVASKSVNALPLSAGSVAGNLASGTVPEAKLSAFKFVKLLPLFATMFPLESRITALEAGKVQKTFFVPAPKFTAESLLDEEIIVSLDKVSVAASVTVPRPTSN